MVPIEDLPFMAIALAPIITLMLLMLNPNSRGRLAAFIVSILVFVFLLPITILYSAILLQPFQSFLGSPAAGAIGRAVFMGAAIVYVVLYVAMLIRQPKNTSSIILFGLPILLALLLWFGEKWWLLPFGWMGL